MPDAGMMGIYDDSFILEYKKLTDMIHEYDANIIMQIVYGGSQTRSAQLSSTIWGPSAIKNESSGIVPIEMTKVDIDYLVNSHAKAAARAKAAGFDDVEIHAAHGYLLSQFLCPHYNNRSDEYGGSIENRARIILEIYVAVRREVGSAFPILIKINSEDFMEDGLTSEDILLNTNISYFGLARPLISEPSLINIWTSVDRKAPKCISCNKCFGFHGKTCIFNQVK